jgi:enoyl-[acyl-carrier protein] reductase I
MRVGNLLSGKRGLVMGVANDKSIAWGIAQAAANQGAEIAFSFQMEGFGKRLAPLAESIGSHIMIKCDVAEKGATEHCFAKLATHWPTIDFVVHALAFSDKNELKGAYMNTSRDNFANTMMVSAYSFTEVARAASNMMPAGGALVTLSFLGAQRSTPNYNVMGVAKAALEASVRYLAVDLGGQNIRVNALSAGPMRTLAGAAITGARHIFRYSEQNAPLHRNPGLEEVGQAGLYLLSDLSSGVTGEVHFVDGGYNSVGIPSAS